MAQKKKHKALKITLLVIALLSVAIIAIVVCIDLLSSPVTIYYSENEDNTYSVSIGYDNRTSSKIKSIKAIKIPTEYKGKPVTKIKNSGLDACKVEIGQIIVPDCIQFIEQEAFFDFLNLKKLVLPSTIKEMGGQIARASIELEFQSNEYFTFENKCIVETSTQTAVFGLNGCTIPDGVKTIGAGAFWGATIENNSLPASISKVNSHGFFSATFNFDKLVLTENIREIGFLAFSYVKGINNTLQISTTGLIDSMAFSNCSINTLIYDVKPNIMENKILSFDSQIKAYYENEKMPQLSQRRQIESDLPGYRKYDV